MRAAMGIAPYIAEAIVREHKHRPITGDVLLLGRQTFSFTPEDAVGMLRSNGIEPANPLWSGYLSINRRAMVPIAAIFPIPLSLRF